MKSLIAMIALVFVVGAAAPVDVAPIVARDGYVIADGADATATVVGRSVSDARDAGSLLYVVVLADEPPSGATTYADAVLDLVPRAEGTVLVVAPETVGWASNNDVWATSELDAALDASLDGNSSNDVVSIFVAELVESEAGDGTGVWIFLVAIGLIAAGIVLLVMRNGRRRTANRERALTDLRAKAQEQIDAIANDILDLEEEVSQSTNADVKQHFDTATDIYTAASERLADAADAEAIVAISTDLDRGIWHLDCAEAILDGNPVPPEPTPPAPAPPSPSTSGVPPAASDGSTMAPLPEYKRRSSRRSGFGADDMLKTVIAMQAMRTLGGSSRSVRSRGSSRAPSGGASGSGGGSRRSSSGGRSRGGGRRRG